MERLRAFMKRVPVWLPTLICLCVILWLSLSPRPFGDMDIPSVIDLDKLAHMLMFFGFTLCVLFDTMHARNCRRLSLVAVALISFIGLGLGAGIEYLQGAMDCGRSFEYADMIADAFGAVLAGALWILIDNAYFNPGSDSRGNRLPADIKHKKADSTDNERGKEMRHH